MEGHELRGNMLAVRELVTRRAAAFSIAWSLGGRKAMENTVTIVQLTSNKGMNQLYS